MLIGHFTEMPYQNPKGPAFSAQDLGLSNEIYDPEVGAQLYNRYFDEKIYAEEVGFDAFMLNEHHSAPFCMQGVTNVGLAILARITKRVKLIPLGNLIPVWDDPLWMAETLAMVDMISGGRLVSGWVRGTGREWISHNTPPVYHRERFDEAHQFIIKTWTTPGPFRWEGKHYQYRYVNPWAVPLQKPHPQIWVPTTVSMETVEWCARRRFPITMTATMLKPTRMAFDYYAKVAEEAGYEAGPQNFGYLWKVHVDETEELAYETGRKFLRGVNNPFLLGNEGRVSRSMQQPPGMATSKYSRQLEVTAFGPAGRGGSARRNYDEQLQDNQITIGTPKSILPKLEYVLQQVRPGAVFFWDGDGSMTHDDQMRSHRLMGQEVIPALREVSKEMGLKSSFDISDGTGIDPSVRGKIG